MNTSSMTVVMRCLAKQLLLCSLIWICAHTVHLILLCNIENKSQHMYGIYETLRCSHTVCYHDSVWCICNTHTDRGSDSRGQVFQVEIGTIIIAGGNIIKHRNTDNVLVHFFAVCGVCHCSNIRFRIWPRLSSQTLKQWIPVMDTLSIRVERLITCRCVWLEQKPA